MAPRSSSSSTETAATWVAGVTRKITADSVTMLRMKKNTPTLTIGGPDDRQGDRAACAGSRAPSVAEASSKYALICLTLVEAIRKPWAW